MTRTARLTQSSKPLPLVEDRHDEDRIDYDTWLLSPEDPSRIEQAMRLCSTAAGPIVFVLSFAFVVYWIV